jgi:diaminopimelate epimerase
VIGKPILEAKRIPAITSDEQFLEQEHQVVDQTFSLSAMSWGNPHTVVYVDDVKTFDVEKYGSAIEYLDCFPERTNVTFAQIVNDSYIKMREWERGTGETLGCGTGCCSAVVISNILGKCGRKVSVEQPGGILDVLWDEEGNVHMYGPSHVVYEGEYLYELE